MVAGEMAATWARSSRPELEREVRRLAFKGHSLREVGRLIERSKHAVTSHWVPAVPSKSCSQSRQ